MSAHDCPRGPAAASLRRSTAIADDRAARMQRPLRLPCSGRSGGMLLALLLLMSGLTRRASAQPVAAFPWTFSNITSKAQAVRQVRQDALLTRLAETSSSISSDSDPSLYTDMQRQFQLWASTFGHSFPSDEQQQTAFDNFVDTSRQLQRVNSNASETFWCGANQFAHLRRGQFRSGFLMRYMRNTNNTGSASNTSNNGSTSNNATVSVRRLSGNGGLPKPQHQRRLQQPHQQIPRRISWIASGKVTSVKDQAAFASNASGAGGPSSSGLPSLPVEGCASGWAFTAVAAMESAYLIARNLSASSLPLLDLSEEQVLQCCNSVHSPGVCPASQACLGGHAQEAAAYASTELVHMGELPSRVGVLKGMCWGV